MITNPKDAAINELSEILTGAFAQAAVDNKLMPIPLSGFVIEEPAEKQNGDLATNAAMVNAKTFKMSPLKLAEIIAPYINLNGTFFERYEIKNPGFINFFFNKKWFEKTVVAILQMKDEYGSTNFFKDRSILVEFVSANPTGPMHIGNARGGAIGDVLCEIYKKIGYKTQSEFYLNDAGNQIIKFGKSLSLRYLELFKRQAESPFDETLYQGDDIIELAKVFKELNGDKYLSSSEDERENALIDFALPKNVAGLKEDLKGYRVEFDNWFKESELYKNGLVEKIIELLKDGGHTYEKDGALWFKTSSFGCEKDDVLVRANGVPTYFVADVAYHYEKIKLRGFDKVVNVWGADHHGHVERLKVAIEALGLDKHALHVVLMQMVRLIKDGEPFKASKRSGNAITLNDLLCDIPVDAARFFFNFRSPGSHFDFDLNLALERSSQNPVYYVQYAHARICSILNNLVGDKVMPYKNVNYSLLSTEEEKDLIKTLGLFPSIILEAAKDYDPSLLTKYAVELASAFHKFYTACNIKNSDEDLLKVRLNLALAVKITLYNLLSILKINAPDKM